MTEPQGGGGTPVTTYEAIILCLLGHEVMAANYSSDCSTIHEDQDDDEVEEVHAKVERGELVSCCWDGISLSEVHQYIETTTISLPSLVIVDGRKTGPVSWDEPTIFNFMTFEGMGPFEVWDDSPALATLAAMRAALRSLEVS